MHVYRVRPTAFHALIDSDILINYVISIVDCRIIWGFFAQFEMFQQTSFVRKA